MTVSSGFAMEIHYCMGKREGVDFYKTAEDKCSRCGMKEKKGGCCNDEHRFYKLADAHKNVFNNYTATISPVALIHEIIPFSIHFLSPGIINALPNKAPPGDPAIPIFLKNCVFRI